jgi:hypothetical protein
LDKAITIFKEEKKMKMGDQIKVTATCIFVAKDKYLFAVEGEQFNEPLIVKRDPADKAHNQRIDDALEELKI